MSTTPAQPSKLSQSARSSSDPDFSLHNQNLVDFMVELERCQDDPRVDFVYKQAEIGQVHPLSQGEFTPLRGVNGGPFDPSQYDLPLLQAQTIFPGLIFPCAKDVQVTLKKDMEGEVYYRFVPSCGSSEQDATASMKLLDNIGNPTYDEPGAITHMRSFTLDRARAEATGWEANGLLGHSVLEVTVAPAKEVIDLKIYQNYLSTTLLSGSKVWLVFPPTKENVDHVHQVYREMHTTNRQEVPHVLPKMQHGIVIIQTAGQTLLLPPYWPAMAFCSRTSTSCSFFTATTSQFMQRVKHMDLRLTINTLCATPEQQQALLVAHATEYADNLARILAEEPKGVKAAAIQQDIYRDWTKATPNHENMHHKIARLLSIITDQKKVHSIRQSVQLTWVAFAARKKVMSKKKQCFWCHMRIENMPGKKDKTVDQRLAQHIFDVHCSL